MIVRHYIYIYVYIYIYIYIYTYIYIYIYISIYQYIYICEESFSGTGLYNTSSIPSMYLAQARIAGIEADIVLYFIDSLRTVALLGKYSFGPLAANINRNRISDP